MCKQTAQATTQMSNIYTDIEEYSKTETALAIDNETEITFPMQREY